MPNRLAQFTALAVATLCLGDVAVAQQVPNAGSILRQLEPETPSPPPLKAQPAPKPTPEAVPSGPSLHVRGFRIEGNHLIATAQIQRLLAGYVNRDVSPADLRQATDSIARLYSHKGWLARALVPPQRVEGGMVLVQIVEGRFGEVVFPDDTDLKSLHVSPQRIVDRVQSRLTPGAPLSVDGLTRGVLLAGDLPGISVAADETSGADNGLTDVVLTVANQNLVSGQFSIDNYGQASIGSERATGWLDFNSVFGFGEEFGIVGILTPDLQFGRFSARLPLNDDGLTLGLDAAGLNYEVHAPAWNATAPRGSSDSFSPDIEYSLIRTQNHNLSVGLTLVRKNFYNDNIVARISDYHVYDALLYADGNIYDQLGGGAVSTAQVSVGRGWVSMAGSPGETDDRFGPDTQGQFGLLRYRVDRTQKLWGAFSGYASLSGQLSYQNLDPSEQFYLGGPGAVRAYPVSSNGGSTGQLLTTELRWTVLKSPRCTCGLKLLYDIGHIRLNANDDFPLAPQPNSYFLQGLGIGAYGTGPGKLGFSVTAVRKVGGDASAEIPDSGLTGARQDTRVWASLDWQF
ncbi:MAG TPA: ShlB/FhaC/HecB family hemolysin secretion/activation protein [Steroidobacteraceae bacterium]|nr:ShlB/FhaC/HecB family hemolysin secretion/activation protein [Steroidobacteraceae bacterium]